MDKEFVWDYKAAGDLMLRSPEIAKVCEAKAAEMTRAAGVPYVADVYVGSQRVYATGKQQKDEGPESGNGKEASGYYRRGKNGETVWGKAYRRKT